MRVVLFVVVVRRCLCAVLFSCNSVEMSSSCDFLTLSPSCDCYDACLRVTVTMSAFVQFRHLTSPLCDHYTIAFVRLCYNVSFVRFQHMTLPSRDSVRIGCLSTLAVFCARWFLHGAWFWFVAYTYLLQLGRRDVISVFNHLVSKTGLMQCSHTVCVRLL
jgi:hypothetical protein